LSPFGLPPVTCPSTYTTPCQILLPNSPPPAPPAQVGSSSSSSGAGYPLYPPPSHQSLGSSASLVPSSFAGSEDADVDDDPTPVPGQPSAFGPNLSQHALYARERADEQATYASYTPSHQHSRSGLSWAAAGGGGYAPSLAGSLGGRSVFDREGGWAQGGAALSRSTSRTSSYAGSELAEKVRARKSGMIGALPSRARRRKRNPSA